VWAQETMYILDGVQFLERKGAILRRERAVHCKVSGHAAVGFAKTAEPIVMLFGMWTPVGPRTHVLGGVHTGATRRTSLNRSCAGPV